MKFTRTDRAWRAVADWLRAWLLRKTATPYECYWRDRCFAAEARARRLANACMEPLYEVQRARSEREDRP